MKNKYFILFPILSVILFFGILIKISETQQKRKSYFGKFENNFCLNNLCIYKEGNDWVYKDDNKFIPVNTELVDIYKQKFSSFVISDVVSDNKEKFKDFGIDDDPLFLKINGKKLEIGNMKSDMTGSYVREENGDSVYFVPDMNLEKDAMRKTRYWDKNYLINTADINVKKIIATATNAEKSRTPNEIDEKLVNNVLRLKTQDFWDNRKPDKTIEEIKIRVEMVDESIDNLQAGATIEGRFWAATDNKFYFEISKDQYGMLTELLK